MIVGFILLAIAIFGIGGFIFMGMMSKADKDVQQDAQSILDKTFNGEETVTYKVVSFGGTLKFDQVLTGAESRGYSLHAQAPENQYMTALVFKKVSQAEQG